MGFGGKDLIEPGSDVYQLDNAFGRTVIDNFATDNVFDLMIHRLVKCVTFSWKMTWKLISILM